MSRRIYQLAAVALFATGILVLAAKVRSAAAGDASQGSNKESFPISAESHIGKPAPDFKLMTLDGKEVSLSAMKGKVVLIDFWATWCPPCVVGLHHLNEVTNDKERAGKGLIVWALNPGDTPEQIKPFVSKPGYALNVLLDSDTKVGQAYDVATFPTRVVIGRDGIVKYAVEGFSMAEDTDDKILAAIDKELAAK